jgi:AcrR family transcriptional regulator
MDNKIRIIEEAAKLFRAYGIKAVTMDSLATQLGMSKRTIYEVFANKDELLAGVLAWMAEKQKELIKRVLNESENAITAIFKLLEISRNHFQSMSPAFQTDMKKIYREILAKKSLKCEIPDQINYQEVIERGIKEKLFRKDINESIVNRCMYLQSQSIMDDDLYPYELFSRREVISNTIISYLRGVSTPEGIDMINQLERKF